MREMGKRDEREREGERVVVCVCSEMGLRNVG